MARLYLHWAFNSVQNAVQNHHQKPLKPNLNQSWIHTCWLLDILILNIPLTFKIGHMSTCQEESRESRVENNRHLSFHTKCVFSFLFDEANNALDLVARFKSLWFYFSFLRYIVISWIPAFLKTDRFSLFKGILEHTFHMIVSMTPLNS